MYGGDSLLYLSFILPYPPGAASKIHLNEGSKLHFAFVSFAPLLRYLCGY
jgi:hypothetical protein